MQSLKTDFELALKMLTRDEGERRTLYDDATGEPPQVVGRITSGIGHNFSDSKLSDTMVMLLFSEDYDKALVSCRRLFPGFDTFSQARRLALLNMAFNLGQTRLSLFVKLIDAVARNDWKLAAYETKRSIWAIQVKGRAHRVAGMLEDDMIPVEYQEEIN